MHTGLTAPADVFHELPAAQALACGITAHLVDPSHLRPARDTDLHYLSPDAYDDPLKAALAADRMAELIAEIERECDAIRNQAALAREQLAEGNRLRREAFAILRHVQACPIDGNALAPIFVRLYDEAEAARRRGFDLIDEHRPMYCTYDPDSDRPPTPDECRADAWRDGWECAAHQ